MATYEYKCDNGHPYTEIRGMTEDQKQTTCAEKDCGLELKRVFSAPPINFKGAGFSSTKSWR